MKLRAILAGLSVAGFCILGAAQAVLGRYVATSEFKALAEGHLRTLAGSEVRIGRIRAAFFNEIILSDISWERSSTLPVRAQVSRIAFRYPLTQLFSRSLRIPRAITLEGLSLEVDDPSVFHQLSGGGFPAGMRSLLTQIRLRGCRISCRIPAFGESLILENLRGRIKPDLNGLVTADFAARAAGLLDGPVRMTGGVDLFKGTRWMSLDLQDVKSGGPLAADFDRLSGRLIYDGETVKIGPLTASSASWKTLIQGEVKDFESGPVFNLTADVLGKKKLAHFGGVLDFKSHQLRGRLETPGTHAVDVTSDLRRKGLRVFADHAVVTGGFEGSGYLDFGTGEYSLSFEKGLERFTVFSNLRGEKFSIGLDLHHFKLFGVDLVMSSQIELKTAARPLGGNWAFDGTFSTDYFILEQAPFENFHGQFRLTPQGIRDLECSWGRVFEMTGQILMRGSHTDAGLVLKVDGLDMTEVGELAAKPLPFSRGILEGKLKIEGDLKKPDISGAFSIKDGKISKLEFDRAMLQFRGFPPYLALSDSRILRGRTTLYIEGAINLSMRHVFSGVRIETADKIILWKGLSLDTSETQGDLEITTPLSELAALNLSVRSDASDSRLGDSDSIQDEKYAALGPKIKF